MADSLYGPFAILASPGALEFARHSAVIKTFGAPQSQQRFFAVARPDQTIFHRPWLGNNAPLDPDAVFRRIMTDLGSFRHPNLYVTSWNEQNQDHWSDLAGLMAASNALAAKLAAVGIGYAGPEYSTGNPADLTGDWGHHRSESWQIIRAANWGGGRFLCLHEYWPCSGEFSTWNALRFLRVHDFLGPEHPPFAILECGIDAVEGGVSGWKRCGTVAASAPHLQIGYLYNSDGREYREVMTPYKDRIMGYQPWPLNPIDPGHRVFAPEFAGALPDIDYLGHHARYHHRVLQYPFVRAVTPFVFGPTLDWWAFDCDGIDWSGFYGSLPEEIPGGNGMDEFTIDAETRAAITAHGWTPAGSYDATPESGGFVLCLEGICWYINSTAEFRFVPFG